MASEEMAQAFILTEEGRAYSQDGLDFVLDQIQETFADCTDVMVYEGMSYNQPKLLAESLEQNPDHSYVFISHGKGIEIMYDVEDINRFIGLLNNASDPKETSWSIIMEELGLL